MTDRRSAWWLAVGLLSLVPAAALAGGGGGTIVIPRPRVAPGPDPRRPDLSLACRLIVQNTNDFRHANGRGRLRVNASLSRTARAFAVYMARTDRYGHYADGRNWVDRARGHGYPHSHVAENIACNYHANGFTTRALGVGFYVMWRNSPGHRRNMLDGEVLETGVGIARSARTGHYYAVQLFGKPNGGTGPLRVVARPAAQDLRPGRADAPGGDEHVRSQLYRVARPVAARARRRPRAARRGG